MNTIIILDTRLLTTTMCSRYVLPAMLRVMESQPEHIARAATNSLLKTPIFRTAEAAFAGHVTVITTGSA